MRYVVPVLLGLATLGGCAYDNPPPVGASAPTVAYPVYGSDYSRTNIEASRYCRGYGTEAQYQSTQPSGSGPVAVYTCTGPRVASAGPAPIPPAPYTSAPYPPPAYAPPDEQLCADPLHQNRPGGSDYRGPPVAGCIPPR
jgi:hypothetical protein